MAAASVGPQTWLARDVEKDDAEVRTHLSASGFTTSLPSGLCCLGPHRHCEAILTFSPRVRDFGNITVRLVCLRHHQLSKRWVLLDHAWRLTGSSRSK